MDNKQKSIYLLKNKLSPYIRVGLSKNVEGRAKTLSTQSGLKLDIIYQTVLLNNTTGIETKLKDALKEYLVFGSWYDVPLNKASQLIKEIESQYKAVAEVEPIHLSIERAGIKQVNNLPQKFKGYIGNYIGIEKRAVSGETQTRYYIQYKYNTFYYYLEFTYKEEAKLYVKKLSLYIQPIERKPLKWWQKVINGRK